MYVDGRENVDDNHDVDDNVYSITSTTTICNLDSVNYPCPHSSFISMLLIVIQLCTFCSGTRLHVFLHTLYLALTYKYVCPTNCRKTMQQCNKKQWLIKTQLSASALLSSVKSGQEN